MQFYLRFMSNEKNLKPFVPGEDARRNTKGRPRKLVLQSKEIGYSADDVRATLETLAAMTLDELKQVFENPNSTALEVLVASVIRKGVSKGSFFNMEMILTRAQGKPKETVDANITGNLTAPVITNVINTGIPLANSEKEVLQHER